MAWFMTRMVTAADHLEMERAIDDMNTTGWELVNVIRDPDNNPSPTKWTLFFKRNTSAL